MNILENNSSLPIYSAVISNTVAYVGMYSTSVFRLAKIDATTGSQTSELSGDTYLATSGNNIGTLMLKVDYTSNDLYVMMKMKTDLFGYTGGNEAMLMRLNSTTMSVIWFERVHGLAANPTF